MSVAEDDIGHHNNNNQSRSYGSRNSPQEYRDNHLINKQIPKGTRRQSPLPLVPAVIIAAHPNSSTQNSNDAPLVVEHISNDAVSQNNDSPNSTTIPRSNQSHLILSKDTTNTTSTTASPSADATMRAPHAVAAVKVPSPIPATTTAIALATTTATLSGSPSPTISNPHETETTIKDTSSLSPVPSNGSTNATAAEDTPVQSKSKTHTPPPPPQSQMHTHTHTHTQTRPKVTTPASPPPSPPSAVGTAVTVTVTGGSGIMVDSPQALLSAATVRSNSATPVRGGSLASLIHSTHREVEVPESTRAGGGGEAHGTPLSPTSMSHGTHSRKDSAATMASASTTGTAGTGTEMDISSLKGGGASGGEPMDIDPSPTTTAPLPQQQQPRSGSGAGSASHTPTGLGSKTAPLPYLPSRSPQPQHPSSIAMPSSLGPHHPHHHPHRPQPSPSPIPSSHPQPSKSPYPHSSAAASTATTHLQRRPSHHSHSRSYSGRTTGSAADPGTAPPQPHSTPRPLSPSSQLRSFSRSDLPPGALAGAGGSDERERREGEYLNISVSEYDEMRMQLAHFASQDEELRAQRDSLARLVDKLEANERYRTQVARGVSEWLKSGETLMRGLVDTAGGASTFNGRGHGHGHPLEATGERDYERERDRAPLSSAMVGGAQRHQQYIDREKTLSVVMPSSPYTPGPHGRPGSGYGHGQDSYSYRHAATPTHPESASHLSRGTGHATRPTHHSTGSNSLRRSRRPSSDDLAEHGGKRIKANNGTIIRTSPDAADRASHSVHHPGPLSASSIGHTLGRTSALGVGRDGTGEFTSYPTSHNRGSGSLGSGTEHGRESPLNRRTITGREEDEDEFPSPRRPHAAPPGAQPTNGNGLASAPTAGRPPQARMAALIAGGDDVDAIGSPDIDTTGHVTLMEMVEEEDADSLRRGAMRHVRGSVLRNGSRSSMNSQDIDEMIAEVADDRGGNGVVRSSSSAKPRYRGPGSSTNPHPGGVLSTFPIHIGQHHEAMSPGLTRSYTPSQASPTKFVPTSSASPAPQQNNSRGFVFRNTDVADMEAQAQARSPEELAHRPSLSGSGSFNGAQTSPPGTSGNPVTTQFLPPQSGPPQPKKIYHSKGTGQVIGSQHVSSMERAPTLPVETVVQPRPLPSNSLTLDGLPKRTCKQCGQPGRYKDNKCVEKWGPGPQGPGTVCDRCRKKMKRVEKRATQDSAAMNAAINHHQYPIAPAPSGGSFGQAPNQGSQRLDESQEYGFSQGTEDGQTQASLSRAPSQNHSSILQGSQAHPGRRGSHAPDQSMHRDATLTYPPNPARETMPPPTSFSTAYGSPKPSRSSRREPSADTRDGDLDADGDAEMDELVDDELAAAAEASGGNRRREQAVKSEA